TDIVMAVLQKHILSGVSFCFSWACPTAQFLTEGEKLLSAPSGKLPEGKPRFGIRTQQSSDVTLRRQPYPASE
ncbi:hypothetical protein J9A95_28130, partial [Klebsiella pneumoniae]